jgi:hypothetical protein
MPASLYLQLPRFPAGITDPGYSVADPGYNDTLVIRFV